MRVLLLFLDGVGIGPDDPSSNPLAAARLPTLDTLLDGRRPTGDAAAHHAAAATLVGMDATFGVPGTPQSGTGHAALFTGEDAVGLFGRHYGPWVPTALRPVVAGSSVLARARAAGREVAFANAYPEELLERAEAAVRAAADDPASLARARRLGPLRSGPPLAALGAGVFTRHTPALERGDAVASEITNEGWIERLDRKSLPVITPEEAGGNLGRITARNDLTLFAHYSTDHVGHRGGMAEAVAAIERVDRFLGGLMDCLPPQTLVFIASDHGNLEQLGRQHTRHPALGVVIGPGHEDIARGLHDLRDVAGAVLGALQV